MRESKIKVNSFLYAAMLAETYLCGIVNTFFDIPNISVVIMCVLLVCSVLNNGLPHRIYYKTIIAVGTILLTLLGSYIYNGAEHVQNYLLHFMAFGLTATYLSSFTIDYRKMFSYVRYIFLIYLILYMSINRSVFLHSPDYWSTQMGMAYAFCSMVIIGMIELIFFRQKVNFYGSFCITSLCITLLATYFLLIDCGTRGALLSICFFIFSLLLIKMSNRRAIFTLIIGSIIGVICVINLPQILMNIRFFLNGIGIKFPALDKTLSLVNTPGGIMNGRNMHYRLAIECIKNSPIIGHGVGYYEKSFYLQNGQSVYVHQFFLEILCEYGFLGLIMVLFFLRKGFLVVFSTEKNMVDGNKILGLVLLCFSIPNLMFSNSYWLSPNFWLFFAWCLYYDVKEQCLH